MELEGYFRGFVANQSIIVLGNTKTIDFNKY